MCALLFRIYLFLLLLPCAGFAQQIASVAAANRIIANADSFLRRMPIEKVFTHTDRPYYSNTDTIWLKNYVLNGLLEYSKQSGVVYAELVNDTGRVVMQQAMPVFTGVNWGQIILDSTLVSEGNYTLRTYTNWMQNTGPESFYSQQLYINGTDENNRRVNAGVRLAHDSVQTRLQILEADGSPLRLQDMQLLLTGGRKTWFREKRQTDLEGKVNLDFIMPRNANPGNLTLIARDRNKKGRARQLVVPLQISRPAGTDVQFMPEGGQLVAGLTSVVGIKAVAENGKGVDVTGKVFNSRKQQVATFASVYKGMGKFTINPQKGETYTAVVNLPGGGTKSYPLPAVKATGIVLSVQNQPADSVLTLTIQASAGLPKTSAYALTGQSGGFVWYGSVLRLTDTASVARAHILKARFPTGVARFTILTNEGQPLAERMVFINHNDRMNISLQTDDNQHPGDSACIAVNVTGPNGLPVQGSFSVAVTDDSQVTTDSLNTPDIYSHMLLSSVIKGYIENPAYYFANNDSNIAAALDNLLLTQGWVGYNWKNAFNPKYKMPYRAQKEIGVSGTVERMGKPQAKMPVVLISTNKPLVVRDTITDAFGRFTFNNLPPFDTAAFVVEAKDKKGKIFKVNIELDKFIPPATDDVQGPLLTPWYVNTDTTMLNYQQKNIAYQRQLNVARYGEGKMLQEVVITAKRMIKGSKNLNGDGNADQILDEKDILKAGDVSLIDLLYKQVKGFSQYRIREKALKFIVDGVEVDFFYDPMIDHDHDRYLTFTLSSIMASDVKGIEVMYSPRYFSKYTSYYDPEFLISTPMPDWPAYIEITTWSGNGLFSKRNPSLSIARPVPVSWPRQFYQPKYTITPGPLTELRPTVYWNPGIVTDTNGNAEVVFYTKKKKTTYTVVMQGSNLDGLAGSKVKRVVVK